MSTTRSNPRIKPRAPTAPAASARARLSWVDAAVRELAGKTLDGLRSPLYRSGYALLANAAGTTVLGAVYWAVAAHLYSAQALGRSSALVAALILVSNLAQLNLHSALSRFLPRAGRSAFRLITYSYGVSSLAALAFGLAFVAILPRLNTNWRFLEGSALLAMAFVAGAVVWGVFNLEDATLVGLHRSVLVPVENVIYGVCKLLLLAIIAVSLPSTGIFVSWVAPLVLIIPAINWLIFRRYLREQDFAVAPAGLRAREVVRFASIDYVGALIGQASGSLLPLLVLSVLGAAANASFYIAWTIAAGLTLVTANFAYSLLVEGATAPHRLPELTRGVLLRCAVITVPGAALLVVAARPILRIYGSAYAANASLLLGLLALAAIPVGLVSVTFSLDRLAGRVDRAAFTQGVLAALTLGGSWLLLRHLGIDGVGLACLGASLVVAAARFPTIAAVLRPQADPAPVPAAAGTAIVAHDERGHETHVSAALEAADDGPLAIFATPPHLGSHSHRATTLGLSALFGTSLALIAFGYGLDIGALRLAGVLGAVFFGVGTAPLQLSERSSLVTRLGVAGVTGLSVLTLGGSVMVLTPLGTRCWPPGSSGPPRSACMSKHAAVRCLGLRGSAAFRSLRFSWRGAFDSLDRVQRRRNGALVRRGGQDGSRRSGRRRVPASDLSSLVCGSRFAAGGDRARPRQERGVRDVRSGIAGRGASR